MPGWAALTLATDADLGAIEPQAVASSAPWGSRTWSKARAEAKRELKILIETSFGRTVKNAADHILDVHRPDYVFSLVSSAYADVTSAAADDTEADLALATIFASTSNRIYIGADYQFEGLFALLTSTRNAVARTLTAKYAGPAGWIDLEAVDGTAVSGATFAQSGRITWGIPLDWQRQELGTTTADDFFWIELSTSGALTAGVTAAQLLPVRAPDGLKRVAALLSLYYVLNGLERQAGKPKDWQDKAAGYRAEALALFQLLKEQGGIPLDRNLDDVVETKELVDTTPVRLGRA
jgi:hypothetical protein